MDGRYNNKIHLDYAEEIRDGNELININCFDYLFHIAKVITDDLMDKKYQLLINLRDFFQKNPGYIENYPYGNLYTEFLSLLEDSIDMIANTNNINVIENAIYSIYANPNQSLERSGKMMQNIIESTKQDFSNIQNGISVRMLGRGQTFFEKANNYFNYYRGGINKVTPQQEGSLFSRCKSMLSPTYQPQTMTGIVSIRKYDYKVKSKNDYPDEYRCPTLAEYYRGTARVNPLFKAFLQVQSKKRRHSDLINFSPITHIYFNNLARDRLLSDYEGRWETALTKKLEELEQHHNNVAVITLPADKGMLAVSLLNNHIKNIDYADAYTRILNIAVGKSNENIQDFYISDRIKEMLYGKTEQGHDTEMEFEIINQLLKNSFEKFNITSDQRISSLELQAVFFDFIKFELTHFIIIKLKPLSFNISCKHGCDRAGVASAYYNLMTSLKDDCALKKEEFIRALHAAPTLTNGRGMNHHIKIIWNVLDIAIKAANISSDKQPFPAWLKEWVLDNPPCYSKEFHLNKISAYINERQMHLQPYYTLLGKYTGYSGETKIRIAKKIKALLKGQAIDAISQEEIKALYNGKLGKIFSEIEKYHLLDLQPYTNIFMSRPLAMRLSSPF